MLIHYVQNGTVIATTTNANIVPRIGDKIKIYGAILKVKDVIWHVDYNPWIEVLI